MLEILNKDLKIQSTTTQHDQNYHYDVLIKAGEKLQELFAHSRILRERSPYFEAALSSTWAKKEDGKFVILKPNISYATFSIIINFIYTNKVDLSQFNGPQVLEILVASDELLILGDLIYPAQDHLIQNEAKWIEQNLLMVFNIACEHEEFKKLQDFCLEIIGWEPSIIFESKDFYDLSEYVLSIILKQDFLQISEIEIWDHLIKWGIHKSKFSDLDNDINYWDLKKEDLFELEKILHDLIPLIRFLEFSIDDCCEKIKPLKDILPLEIKHELWNYHKYPKTELDHILPIRSPILNNFESKLLNRDQINKFKKFIYKNDDFSQLLPNNFNKDISRLKFNLRLLIRGSRDGLSPKKFHHLCDNTGPNIVIMKVKKNQQIIGGYNPVGWFGKGIKWRYTQKGFLFSFGTPEKQEFLISRPKQRSSHYTIYDDPHAGPSFGTPEKQEFLISRPKQRSSHYTIYDDPHAGPSFGINDLRFYKQFNSDSNNCCAIPTVFEKKIINETEFVVEDYEVYQIYLDSDLKNIALPLDFYTWFRLWGCL